MTASINEDLSKILAEFRDSVMKSVGSLQASQQKLTDEVMSVRVLAERASRDAADAKRAASDSVHEFGTTKTALIAHVGKLQEQIAQQATAKQADANLRKLSELRLILVAYVPAVIVALAIVKEVADHFLK